MSEPATNGNGAGEATELVYLTTPSWAPAMFAFGVAAIPVGILIWWPYGAAGAIFALAALWVMVRGTKSEATELPRDQHLTTAVLPPVVSQPRD